MDWWPVVAEVGTPILTVMGVIAGWIFRRELTRNETDHKSMWDRMNEVEDKQSFCATREEMERLKVGADMRFERLDQDIKNTGSEVQRVLREELGKVNARLDQMIMSMQSGRRAGD